MILSAMKRDSKFQFLFAIKFLTRRWKAASSPAAYLFVWSAVVSMGVMGCGGQDGNPQGKTLKDLNRAIHAIENRREAEYRILEEYDREIDIFEDNLGKVNSNGMREKIQGDIEMRRSAMWKAEKNIANQDSILGILYFKRDSMRAER